MARLIIIKSLRDRIYKDFKGESKKIFHLMIEVSKNPQKGRLVGVINETVIKEIRYKKYRFYFVAKGDTIKYFSKEEFKDEIIKFVRMSQKKDQQKIIDEIKEVLKNMSDDWS